MDRMTNKPTCDRLIDGAKCQLAEDAARLGVNLAEMPPSRHAWDDIIRCPNDGCGREFLVTNRAESVARLKESEIDDDEYRLRNMVG